MTLHVVRLGAGLAILALCALAEAQTVPPGAFKQLDSLVGARAETLAIFGTQSGPSGGTYASDVNDSLFEIFKVTGRGDLSDPHPMGDSGVGWNLVLEGGIGVGTFNNRFDTNELAGNRSEVQEIAASLGLGVRFTFLERLSIAPTFGVIYTHAENEFTARTDLGRAVLAQFDGKLVNWTADLITLVPAIEGRYRQPIGPVTVEVTSRYKYFDTRPIQRSTTAFSFESHSQLWRNELDVDLRLPVHVFTRQLRTGVTVARSELLDGLKSSLKTDHIYDAGGRLVVDLLGVLWKVEWIGIGGTYFWSDNLSGWSIGGDVRLKF